MIDALFIRNQANERTFLRRWVASLDAYERMLLGFLLAQHRSVLQYFIDTGGFNRRALCRYQRQYALSANGESRPADKPEKSAKNKNK